MAQIPRLGLEGLQIRHSDRQSLILLKNGKIYSHNGTMRFYTTGTENLSAGAYDIPCQNLSLLLLGPGTTISQDALRLAAHYGMGVTAVGDGGVRLYSAFPKSPDNSDLARKQALIWADPQKNREMVLNMYRMRFGKEDLPTEDPEELFGIEGSRGRQMYRVIAQRYGIEWTGRKFDRNNPDKNNDINNAINHAATAAYAAANIAVAATGTIPQLGFIHKASYYAFGLDIADLFRDTVTLPVAFQGLRAYMDRPDITLERHVRKYAGRFFTRETFISKMIDAIEMLLDKTLRKQYGSKSKCR